MSKRPRVSSGLGDSQDFHTDMAAASDHAEGGVGVETLPNVPENFVPQQHQYGTTVRKVKSGGTFWMHNVTPEGLFGGNLWHQFPWEFMQIHMDELMTQELYTNYKLWKPLSCSITFSNPNMFIDTSTDTNPLMTETTQGEVTIMTDASFINSGPSSAIWGRASADTSVDTVAETVEMIQSWKANGYTSNTATDVIKFLPVQAPDPTNINYIRANFPDTKLIGVGNGQKVTKHWNYSHCPYWRRTNELTATPVFAVSQFVPGAPSINTRAFGRRTDWLGGSISPAYGGTQAVQTNPVFGNGPLADQSTQTTVFNPTTLANAQTYCDPNPQPPLLLHLKPHAQAFAAVGQTVCQLDFEITYTILLKNEAPRQGRAVANTATGVGIGTNPSLFGPAFEPWIIAPTV